MIKLKPHKTAHGFKAGMSLWAKWAAFLQVFSSLCISTGFWTKLWIKTQRVSYKLNLRDVRRDADMTTSTN